MMMMRTAGLATALMFLTAPALAADTSAGPLRIETPWARATPKGAQVGAGYMTVRNTGSTPDRLTCVSADIAERCEVHTMAEKDGVATMRPLPDGLEIKPGEAVALKPGSFHLMFVGLKTPAVRGQPVKVQLRFEKAGTVTVEFDVAPPGAPGPSPAGHGGGKH